MMTLQNIITTLASVSPNQVFEQVTSAFVSANRFHRIAADSFEKLKKEPWPKSNGAYVVRRAGSEGMDGVLYIGKTGKLQPTNEGGVIANSGKLIGRLSRWTPYCFQSEGPFANHFEYGPNYGVNEIPKQPHADRYRHHISLAQVWTDCFATSGIEQEVSPAFLETLLLQAYVCGKAALPPANQEL